MKREFGRGRKILENGISPIAPFPAKAGPTECSLLPPEADPRMRAPTRPTEPTQSKCGTGFSREDAGLSAADSRYEVYG
jgi:hypothetical protein